MAETRMTLMMITIVVLASLQPQHAMASTLKVGTCVISQESYDASAHFATIQAAVNAASPGSTVLVCPGTYAEQVVITQPLTLRGVQSKNMGAAVIVPPTTGLIVPAGTSTYPQVFVYNTAGPVTVSNLTVDGRHNQVPNCDSFMDGVYFLAASGTMENIVARNQKVFVAGNACGTGIGLRVTGDVGNANVSIQHNTVSAYDFGGIFASYPQATVNIQKNSVVGPGEISVSTGGIILFDDVVATVSENSVVDNPSAALSSAGIDVVGVENVVVSRNTFGNNAYGIAFYTFTGDPNSDNGTVSNNNVYGSSADAIAVCGDNNSVTGNTLSDSRESGVNLTTFAAMCTANNNTVSGNTINGACAGILIDPSTTGNVIGDANRMFNANSLQVTGTSCPVTAAADAATNTQSVHPPSSRMLRWAN
jgi:parallel beta-helix repeat protein